MQCIKVSKVSVMRFTFPFQALRPNKGLMRVLLPSLGLDNILGHYASDERVSKMNFDTWKYQFATGTV